MTAALPEWNLDHLYSGPDAPELKADLDAAHAGAVAFRESYAGKLTGLDGAEAASGDRARGLRVGEPPSSSRARTSASGGVVGMSAPRPAARTRRVNATLAVFGPGGEATLGWANGFVKGKAPSQK